MAVSVNVLAEEKEMRMMAGAFSSVKTGQSAAGTHRNAMFFSLKSGYELRSSLARSAVSRHDLRSRVAVPIFIYA